jgi:hypothetical protein
LVDIKAARCGGGTIDMSSEVKSHDAAAALDDVHWVVVCGMLPSFGLDMAAK